MSNLNESRLIPRDLTTFGFPFLVAAPSWTVLCRVATLERDSQPGRAAIILDCQLVRF
jgi:hypothetical protein